jgi:hypothetical protein
MQNTIKMVIKGDISRCEFITRQSQALSRLSEQGLLQSVLSKLVPATIAQDLQKLQQASEERMKDLTSLEGLSVLPKGRRWVDEGPIVVKDSESEE